MHIVARTVAEKKGLVQSDAQNDGVRVAFVRMPIGIPLCKRCSQLVCQSFLLYFLKCLFKLVISFFFAVLPFFNLNFNFFFSIGKSLNNQYPLFVPLPIGISLNHASRL